jgi:hypothetical protein
MQRRQQRAALLLVAALALSGCGGSGGDPTTFAATAELSCEELSSAVAELRTGLVRTDAASEAAGLSVALRRYAAAVDRTAGRLAAADPPKVDAAFQTDAVKGLRHHAATMRQAAGQARRGRVAAGLRDELRGGSVPMVPASVLKDAPACAAR